MHESPIPVVGALIFNKEAKLFLMRSSGKFGDDWIIPGGKVNWGEELEAALRREIKEETNLELSEVKFLGVREMINTKNHYIFLEYSARTLFHDNIILNHEAVAFRWFTPEDLSTTKLAAPTRELIYERTDFATGSLKS